MYSYVTVFNIESNCIHSNFIRSDSPVFNFSQKLDLYHELCDVCLFANSLFSFEGQLCTFAWVLSLFW